MRASRGDYRSLLLVDQRTTDAIIQLRRITEMILVREFDAWHAVHAARGDPGRNISKANRLFCAKLAQRDSPPSSVLQLTGTLLAWTHARLERDAARVDRDADVAHVAHVGHSDDAFVLLEHVMSCVAPIEGDHLTTEEPWPELEEAQTRWRGARSIPAALADLSIDERAIYNEVLRWELKVAGKLSRFEAARGPAPYDVTVKPPRGVARIATNTLQQALGAFRDAANVFVRDDRILGNVRERGYAVEDIADLHMVPLEVLDEISGSSLVAGQVLGALEGAGTGVGGLLLTALDIPALLTINLRFIVQIAHTYGFETATRKEQAFVLNVLGAASAGNQRSRREFLDSMNRLSETSLQELDSNAFVALLRTVAEKIGVRFAERKLAQVLPLAGALVGGGVNYAYTRDCLVCARMMYRKRRLAESFVPLPITASAL